MAAVPPSRFFGAPRTCDVRAAHARAVRVAEHRASEAKVDVFYTQREAFSRTEGCLERVWAVEVGQGGKRRFLVASVEDFWARYFVAPQRHHYELIREGAPCRLYLDVEFNRDLNRSLSDEDGGRLLDEYLHLLRKELCSAYGVREIHVRFIVLASSTAAKFSRHVIAHVSDGDDTSSSERLFRDNSHVGAFVRLLNAKLRADNAAMQRLSVRLAADERGLFVDEGVYSRNRTFRLFLSSKLGKDAVLRPVDRRMVRVGPSGMDSHSKELAAKAVFMDALVVPATAGGTRFMECVDVVSPSKPLSVSTKPQHPQQQQQQSHTCEADTTTRAIGYPRLAAFVRDRVLRARPGAAGRLQKTLIFDEGRRVLFPVAGNRYCERIGREHKSNGVYFLVRVPERQCVQRCYDPDCRDFEGRAVTMPHFVLESRAAIEAEEEAILSLPPPPPPPQ